MTAPAARASAPASASATYVPRREGLEASGLSSAPGSGASLVAVGVPDGEALPFAIDLLRREALLHGLDDIGLTLKDDGLIREWQAADRQHRPWAWPAPRPRP